MTTLTDRQTNEIDLLIQAANGSGPRRGILDEEQQTAGDRHQHDLDEDQFRNAVRQAIQKGYAQMLPPQPGRNGRRAVLTALGFKIARAAERRPARNPIL